VHTDKTASAFYGTVYFFKHCHTLNTKACKIGYITHYAI